MNEHETELLGDLRSLWGRQAQAISRDGRDGTAWFLLEPRFLPFNEAGDLHRVGLDRAIAWHIVDSIPEEDRRLISLEDLEREEAAAAELEQSDPPAADVDPMILDQQEHLRGYVRRHLDAAQSARHGRLADRPPRTITRPVNASRGRTGTRSRRSRSLAGSRGSPRSTDDPHEPGGTGLLALLRRLADALRRLR